MLLINKKIYIYGTGGHAKVVTDIINSQELYTVESYIDDNKKEDLFLEKPVLDLNDIESNTTEEISFAIAVGDNKTRASLVTKVKNKFSKANFPALVHRFAIISPNAIVGEGSVVVAGVNIAHSCKVSPFCIVNSSASIDHDCVLGKYSFIAPGVILGGTVSVGEYSFVGLGAKVINNINIGKNCIIGAGSVVLESIEDNQLSYGNPAKVIKKVD